MNWIKKKLSQLLKNENENENEQYNEFEEYYEEDYEEYEEAEPKEKKTSFRFPLIADEEIAPHEPKQQNKQAAHTSSVENKPLELPKHLQQATSKVYDVEVQGIRDLLERRQQRTGHSNVLRNKPKEARKLSVPKKAPELVLKKSPELPPKKGPELPSKKAAVVEKDVNREFINPLENRKRFVPTEVPSPIHGFQKPKPIEELMAEKHLEVAATVEENPASPDELNSMTAEQSSNVIVFGQSSNSKEKQAGGEMPFEEGLNAVDELVVQPVEEGSGFSHPPALVLEKMDVTQHEEEEDKRVAEELKLDEEKAYQPAAETIKESVNQTPNEEAHVNVSIPKAGEHEEQESLDAISDVQVQHLTIENSTIHVGQLNVEQAHQNEFVQVKTEEPKSASSGSRLPFNVLMLKSDKEKLLAKEILQGQLRKKKQDEQTPKSKLNVPVVTEIAPEIEVDFSEPADRDKGTALEQTSSMVAVLEREETAPEIEHNVEITEEEEPVVVQTTELLQEENKDKIPDLPPTLPKEDEAKELHLVQERANEVDRLLLAAEEQRAEEETEQVVPLQEGKIEEQSVTVAFEVPEEQVEPKFSRHYEKPSLSFLAPPEEKTEDWAWMDEQGERLIMALSYFHIDAEIVSIVQGPAVTQFEITVAHGTKVSKVRGLADDIKLALAARDIRIDAPIPGKHSIGIEIPNRVGRAVRLSEVTDSKGFQASDSPLEAALGLDLTGQPITIDLRKMPHGLIAGATGSGKSVCINSILVSLLYKADPHELKLMLIDPKMVELAPFNHIPHLVSPVITDVKAATAALKWAVEEMERRYQLFMHAGVRDITRFNQQAEKAGQYAQKMPYILIVIDELADLMMMSPADVEEAICRIAQKARACGIHLIVATQRPSVDVITGLIKSNIPTRIAFAVSSAVDSRTILDMQGAERLLGRGDMLYLGNGMPAPVRLQGTFVTDDEIEEIIAYVRSQGEPEYMFEHDELLKKAEVVEEQDELFEEVCRYVFEQGTASTSSIQRRYKIGYNRAARLVDMLERHGFVSEQKGSKPRDVFITESDIISMFE